MDFSIRPMAPPDWPAVRAVYLEGIGSLGGRWRDVVLLERRSPTAGV